MTNWKTLIEEAMSLRGEVLAELISNTLTDDEMVEMFHDGFGSSQGKSFTAWTENTVYFPLVYDGSEWVGSVSRHPNGQPTEHQGGE